MKHVFLWHLLLRYMYYNSDIVLLLLQSHKNDVVLPLCVWYGIEKSEAGRIFAFGHSEFASLLFFVFHFIELAGEAD